MILATTGVEEITETALEISWGKIFLGNRDKTTTNFADKFQKSTVSLEKIYRSQNMLRGENE